MKQPKRDWTSAREKVRAEGRCRVCTPEEASVNRWLESAHTIDRQKQDVFTGDALWVNPSCIIPLCRQHHQDYDARKLDILPHLTKVEQAYGVLAVGIISALRRFTGSSANRDFEELKETVVDEARLMCQWLDYHAEDVQRWGPWGVHEAEAHERLHDAVTAYEKVIGASDED